MWPDEEDEPVAGPVPDPSERTWRHPSEIGAGLGASSTPVTDPGITVVPDVGRSRSGLWPAAVLGSCISVAALGVVALYLVASPSSVTRTTGGEQAAQPATAGADQTPTEDEATAEAAADPTADAADGEAAEPGVDDASGSTTDTESTGSTTDAGPDEQSGSDQDAEADLSDELSGSKIDRLEKSKSRDETDGLGIDGSIEDDFGLLTEDRDLLDDSLVGGDDGEGGPPVSIHEEPGLEVATVGPGVFASPDNGAIPLAGLTAVEGLLLTSASAIGRLDTVHLPIDGRWVEVRVEAVDHWTDLALLRPTGDDESAEDGQSPSEIPQLDSDPIGPAVLTGDAVRIGGNPPGRAPGPPAANKREMKDWAEPDPIAGQVVSLDAMGDNGTDVVLYDLILADIPFETGFAGMPLFDDQGRLVGLIVNGRPSHNVHAVPIDRALRYGRSLLDLGVADPATLGCETADNGGGPVEVIAVDPAGPAGELLQPGDRIVSLDGVAVDGRAHLMSLIRSAGAGTPVELGVRRNGRLVAVPFTIGGAG